MRPSIQKNLLNSITDKSKTMKVKAHHYPVMIMGCGFVITAVHEDPKVAWRGILAAENEMRRIESLISSWKDESQTTAINNAAGFEAITIDQELYDLIQRSQKVAQLTNGAFDISGNLSRHFWNFDKQENDWLSDSKIEELKSLINYQNIILNERERSVHLAKAGMKIGFGGIGKGYAAERAKLIMLDHGIENGLINASGDLKCWGSPPDQDSWDIAIPDPRNRCHNLLTINLEEGAVVTSGSYENYTIIDGRRYSHIINPRTGTPVNHTKNVTFICPNAEFADAMATAFSVLPIDESLSLCNHLDGAECIIIDAHDNVHFSNQLKQKAYA